MFYAPGLIFGGTVGLRSRFHVFCSRTRFRRYRGGWVPFSCFALPDSFSAVQWASGPFFMFCAPGLVLDGTRGVGSRVLVLRARTRFRQLRGRRVPFSCFAPPYPFSVVPRESGPDFMFCAPRLIIDGTEGVRSLFHVLRTRTRFRQYGGRSFPFSCFSLPDIFSAVPKASSLVFMFCAPGLIFNGIEGVVSSFYIL
jgi:hypothetical protein